MTLNNKLESAIAAYLESETTVSDAIEAAAGDILTGANETIKTTVALVVVTAEGREEPERSGNFDVPVEVQLHWASNRSALTEANAAAALVQDALWVNELAANIQTNGSGIAVNGCHSFGHDLTREDDAFIYVWSFTVSCRLSR